MSINVGANKPHSKYAQKYSPADFPIHCSFLVSKSNAHVIDEIKDSVKDLPKENYRVRKTVNKYVGVSLNIFLKDVDSIRPIANSLNGKDLNIDHLGASDKKIFPRDMISLAQEVQRENSHSVV